MFYLSQIRSCFLTVMALAFLASPASARDIGDANGDGLITADDATIAAQVLFGTYDGVVDCPSALDGFQDGSLGISDTSAILSFVAGDTDGAGDVGTELESCTESLIYRGDVDGNGLVEEQDVTELMEYLFRSDTDGVECVAAIDANSDGSFGIPDAIWIYSVLSGAEDLSPMSSDEC